MPSRTRSIATLLLGVATLLGPILRAQTPPDPQIPPPPPAQQPEEPIHTLHVYMDLIQIPVLVLDSELERMKPILPAKFLVSLDSGPVFRPRHVRQEGDDPITLAILLDVNGEPDVMPRIGAAIASLAPASLHPSDHITVYGLDCKLIRTLVDAAADPVTLHAAVDDAVASWTERRKIKHAAAPPCDKRVNLWDATALAVRNLGELPGRRVLLAVTNGVDHGSTVKWNDLRSYAQMKGVAIFGYAERSTSGGRMNYSGLSSGRPYRSSAPYVNFDGTSSEDPFSSICQLSGGMILTADPAFVPKQLARFTILVRERYIIEFSRARNDTPGEHNIQVTVSSHPTAYIRPAGVTILMPDNAVASDPNTIPRDTTDAPEIGKRKPLPSPH
jgi:hypothetical protein